jgi:DNA-binding MarR family transcriptional regulator
MFLLVQQMTRRFQEVLRPHGVTPLHWGILCCLWREDGLRTSQIASRLEQLGGTVTVGLDVMERHRLVQRKKDKSDGRVSRVFLTNRGRTLRQELEPAAASLILEMFATLAPEEFRSLSAQITHLRQVLDQAAASTEGGRGADAAPETMPG